MKTSHLDYKKTDSFSIFKKFVNTTLGHLAIKRKSVSIVTVSRKKKLFLQLIVDINIYILQRTNCNKKLAYRDVL